MSRLLRALGILIYHLGLARAVMWLNRGVPRVLAYHACEETESPFLEGLGCNTAPSVLRGQLEFLARYYTVIPIQQLESAPIPPRAVVITFDDGYRSVYTNAFPLLRDRGMPAIVYLIGTTRDGARLVWVNELNWYLRTRPESMAAARRHFGLLSTAAPSDVLQTAQLQGSPASIDALLEQLAQKHGVDRRAMARESRLYVDATEIADMRAAGIAFGNHTDTHPNLAALDESACRSEIERGRQTVGAGASSAEIHPSLAYPFGNHNDMTRRIAIELGHRSIMQVGGWNRPLDLSRVRRVPVYATTVAAFFAEMEVVEPLKARIRKLMNTPEYGYVSGPSGGKGMTSVRPQA